MSCPGGKERQCGAGRVVRGELPVHEELEWEPGEHERVAAAVEGRAEPDDRDFLLLPVDGGFAKYPEKKPGSTKGAAPVTKGTASAVWSFGPVHGAQPNTSPP